MGVLVVIAIIVAVGIWIYKRSQKKKYLEVSVPGRVSKVSKARSAASLDLTFAVVDVETTGLDSDTDRIIEIGVVTINASGVVSDRWSTLVNPGDTVAGATHIHGIEGDWLAAAPTFEQVAGDLATRLVGTYPVSHNAKFDWAFIEEEYERIGYELGDFTTVCTLDLARGLGLPGRLNTLSRELGIDQTAAHTAEDDAYVTSQVLARLLPLVDASTFSSTSPVSTSSVPPIEASGISVQRQSAQRDTAVTDWMAEAVDNLPTHDASTDRDPAASGSYLDLLEDAMADGVLTRQERTALVAMAKNLNLSTGDLEELHDGFFSRLVDVALLDRKLTADERKDLDRAAAWLGIDDLKTAIAAGRERSKELVAARREGITGKVIAFTGAGVHNAEVREALAAKYSFQYRSRMRDDVDLLVIGKATVDNQQVMKAREADVPVIVEEAFWVSLGAMQKARLGVQPELLGLAQGTDVEDFDINHIEHLAAVRGWLPYPTWREPTAGNLWLVGYPNTPALQPA